VFVTHPRFLFDRWFSRMLVDGDSGRLIGALLILAFPCLLVVAALGDVTRFRISNRLNILLALLYLPAAIWMGSDGVTVLWHLGAGAAVLVVGILLFATGVIGGGDVKLLAASSCWVGFANLPLFLITVALAGGVLALALIVLRWALADRISPTATLARLLGRSRDVPYGLAIAIGGLVTLPRMDLVRPLLGG
jgi:prepilin peptidase CpaA